MTDKIKSCPFCGGEAEIEQGIGRFEHSVVCQDCRCKTRIHAFEEEAIEAWNTRKPMDRIIEQLEEKENDYTYEKLYQQAGAIMMAIEIVKAGGKDE